MYYPYLRGKQYELLALREFAPAASKPCRIWPILEPVRDPSTNTSLARAMRDMAAQGMGFTVVVNPTVGDLSDTPDAARTIVHGVESSEVDPSLVRLGILLGGQSLDHVARAIAVSDLSTAPVDFIYRAPAPTTQSIEHIVSKVTLGRHFASDKSIVRRYKAVLPPRYEVVKFDDRFPVRESNMEYVPLAESLFTDDHLYYKEDGYFGFGDYVTIGVNYRDGGSSPRAVVIHFTYVEPNEGTIEIRHFASDSNHDTSDTAAKFAEATGKLLAFTTHCGITNPAVEAFQTYYDTGHYPGLGMIKKLSILNHLFLVDELLDQP